MTDDNQSQIQKLGPEKILTEKKTRELSEIINKGNVLGFTEFITGLVGTSKTELLMSTGRLGQAMVKGNLVQQLFVEVQELRKKGRINDEYIQSEYGQKEFADILEHIENENLDPKKWDAIKNLFYHSVSKDINEKQRMRSRYLMQICFKLSAFDIEVLSVVYSIFKTPNHPYQNIGGAGEWIDTVSEKLEYGLPELVGESEDRLIKQGLLSDRQHPDRSGVQRGVNFRLTNLGNVLCELIVNFE